MEVSILSGNEADNVGDTCSSGAVDVDTDSIGATIDDVGTS